MSNIHCNDNNNLEKNDRFSKIRPLFNALNNKFFNNSPVEENHSVDEAMVPYFGRRMPYGPFHLFFDNYFTSLSLLKELGARNMKGTGTIRENRIPECPLKRSSDLKVSDRGTFDYSLVDDDIVICKWNDNSVVTLASNASAFFHYIMPKDFRNLKKNIYT
nr:unnamed protein product [Callosobruchus analis]